MSGERKIAHCGIDCEECPALKAFALDSDELREKTAKEWSEIYKADIKPEDINCSGCQSEDGIKFRHCYECKIRDCCRVRKLENCAYCDDYGCEKISWLLEAVPDAKANLELTRASK